MNFSRTLVLLLTFSMTSSSYISASSDASQNYWQEQYKKNRTSYFSALGTLTFLGHLCAESLNKSSLIQQIPATQVAAPVLLAASALAFGAAVVAPMPAYDAETHLFSGEQEAHDYKCVTKLWAVAGLAITAGTIGYTLVSLNQTNFLEDAVLKLKSFFEK